MLAAVLFHVGETTTTSARFADNLTATLIASGILPLVMLLFATSSFGNELVDRTLGYLTLKPLARWRIVVPKLLAALLVGGVPVAASGFLAVALVGDGAVGGAVATALGLLVGAAAYAAIFTWAGLATRHALLIGLVYVFVWEATLAAYLDGIRFLSVRRYTLSAHPRARRRAAAKHRQPAVGRRRDRRGRCRRRGVHASRRAQAPPDGRAIAQRAEARQLRRRRRRLQGFAPP